MNCSSGLHTGCCSHFGKIYVCRNCRESLSNPFGHMVKLPAAEAFGHCEDNTENVGFAVVFFCKPQYLNIPV